MSIEPGSPWTNVRFFSTFNEADEMRSSLKSADHSGTLQIKIKRCGEGGTTFVVKTRQCGKLEAAVQQVEQELSEQKPAKKTRKTKK